MARALVLAPHPDDDIIGCGGSIAKLSNQGHEVVVVYFTSGEAGSLEIEPSQLARIREDEARRAGRMLGVSEFLFWRQPDGFLQESAEITNQLVRLIRARQFSTVYLPHKQEANRDHAAAYHIGREACNRAAGPWFKDCGITPWTVDNILGYEVWTPLQEVSYVEDISDTMDIKMQALQQHQSQLSVYAYDEAIRGLNRYRGITSGQKAYGEAFVIYKVAEVTIR